MTRKSLPKNLEISPPVPELAPGLVGLVQAVGAAMAAGGDERGVDEDDLVCISTAAFTTYAFDPTYNQHEDERREYSPHAELFSNYGPWSAIRRYTGWTVREVSDLSSVDMMKLVAFELAAGRPLVTLDPSLRPQLLTAYEIDRSTKRVRSHLGSTWDLDRERLQDDDEVFRNWMLLVRPDEPEPWTAEPARQRADVLRWAVEHAHNTKEFFQETRENYKPGLLGVERFREFLDELTETHAASFAERFVERMHAARGAAARTLPRWAGTIAEHLDQPGVEGPLLQAADAYAEVARALGSGAPYTEMFADVSAAERAAVAALEAACVYLPGPFEP